MGLLGCIWRVVLGTYEMSISPSGISIQWGEPAIANAIVLAKLVFLTKILEFFAPEDADAAATSQMQAHMDGQNGAAVEPAQISPKPASPGVSEPIKKITYRATGIILGLVASQMGPAEAPGIKFLEPVFAALSVPFRLGFPLCTAAMIMQVFMVLAFAAYHCEAEPVPEPPLDGTGTLQWEPESETGRKVVGSIASMTMLLLQGGLTFGMLGLGVLPWVVIKLGFFLFVFPFMNAQGKSNVMNALGWHFYFMRSFLGVLGAKFEAYMEERRKVTEAAEAAAAKQAAEALAEEESRADAKAAPRKESKDPDAWKSSPKKKDGLPKQKGKKK